MRILYLDLDALNPGHLGCYGYHRNTSPTMDQLAREGLRMTHCYASDAPCLPSRTAFYSGRFGIQTGVVGHGATAAQPKIEGPTRGFRDTFDTQGVAGCLQKAGFYTVMISPFGQRHAAWHFYAGFNEMHNTGKGGEESAEDVMPTVQKWFEDNARKDNWYLHVNFWDVHTPYRAPASYPNPFEDEPVADWFTDELIASHIKKTGPHSAQDIGMYGDATDARYPRVPARVTDRASLKQWIDGYDTAIRYVDDQIAWMIRHLKQAGIYEDTAIIVSADHGENQGDLGIYGEHGTADQATCRIPMIIKWPEGVSGHVDEGLHYNLDMAPTVMELLGQAAPELWDGQSFAPTILNGDFTGRDDLVLSQCAHVCQRSVRFDRWIYIRTYHDGNHLFPQEMLFDLENDPHELHDVAQQHPDVCREGAHRLLRWHDQQMQKMARTSSDVVDPLWTVIREGGPFHARNGVNTHILVQYIKRLESTGRADGAAALRAKYARELVKTS
jgi:choline-sulfatase